MDKAEAKRLMATLSKVVEVTDYSVQIGRATIGLAGELTVKIILTPATGAAAARFQDRTKDEFDAIERYRSGDPIPYLGIFIDGKGKQHTAIGHTRTAKVITQTADGKKWTWKREAVQISMALATKRAEGSAADAARIEAFKRAVAR